MNSLVLIASVAALASNDPEWSQFGALGLVAYCVVSLGTAWIQAHKDSEHRDDCARYLRQIHAAVVSAKPGREGDGPCLRNGRHKPQP